MIASGQGFFAVATSASASLNITEACKVSTQPSTLLLNALPVANVPQYMHLKMIKDSVNYDDVIIAFKAGTDTKYSIQEDALHLTGNSPPEPLPRCQAIALTYRLTIYRYLQNRCKP